MSVTSPPARPIPLKKRRQVVALYGLSAAVFLLSFLFGGSEQGSLQPIFWAAAPAVLIFIWSGAQLTSPEWGFHGWRRQPDALDERQRARAL